MRRRYGIYIGACMCSAVILGGCGSIDQNSNVQAIPPVVNETQVQVETGEETSTAEEELKEEADIIVDRLGYRQFCRKNVYVLGNDINPVFEVRDEEKGKVVFTGSLRLVDDKDYDGKRLYLGDFSDYKLKGTFRIYQEDIGCSHLFSITPDRYKNEYKDIYEAIEAVEYSDISDWLYGLDNMLLAKDMYEDTYLDANYIESSLKNIMEYQDAETGVIAEDANNIEETGNLSATAQYAGLLAHYNIMFSEENPELAKECLDKASKAFAYVERNRDELPDDTYYYAASELYRATGQYIYRGAIERYDSLEEVKTSGEYDYKISADIAYLKTNYRIDYERCQGIMKEYQHAAEDISSLIDKNHFHVQKDIEKLTDEQILCNMQKLGLVSYVVSGYEYAGILENYVHYLDGLNEASIFVITDKETIDEELEAEDAIELSKLLFAIGHLYNS